MDIGNTVAVFVWGRCSAVEFANHERFGIGDDASLPLLGAGCVHCHAYL